MVWKILKYILLSLAGIILVTILILLMPALWHRWITYPRLEREVVAFAEKRQEQEAFSSLKTFRGVMHVHSFWSHDSEGTLIDLIPAAKKDSIDFIFLTDHPRGNIDTIPHCYKGYYNGVLIEPGSEKLGFDTWPLDTAIIDWNQNKDTIARNITGSGGIIFYAHPEEPHNWNNPYYQGMEIYNFHADTRDEKLLPLVINYLVNGDKYGSWAQREMFDEQTAIMYLWDSLNCNKKIVGFSAVDTHENQNIRARYLSDGRVEWVGPNANVMDTMTVNFWNRWLLKKPDENGWIFRLMIDTYMTGFNHITNYVLADTLSVQNLAYHIKKGNLFTAFKSLGDAKGFLYYSLDKDNKTACITGDSISLIQVKSLGAVSPLPGRFRLVHNGKIINTSQEDSYKYSWSGNIEKGGWRLEMQVKSGGKYVPWIYTNPIYVY